MSDDTRPGLPPRRHPAGAGWRGFTLVEVILVLAVIMLLGALLLPGVNSMLRATSNEEPDRIFWDVVIAARELALTSNQTVLLRFDKEKNQLDWSNGTAVHHKVIPAGVGIQFLQARAGSSILLGGVLVETQEIPVVRFYPDGTCDRFRVQLRRGQETPQVIAVDPWTCAPMLEAAK
jgi:type II secretory pathway pseudopilin PulG